MLILNVCDDIIHQTCAGKPNKRSVLECSCDVVDDKDLLLSLEKEINMNEKNNKDKVELAQTEEIGSVFSNNN